jgi:phosphoribosyl 1,2-cyclic phosphodiesterase
MNEIKFLGTAGARFVVSKQMRNSGGIWLNIEKTKILIDPGPGSLIRCLNSRPKIIPQELNGIILTHRHLDHSNDVNIIIEAMTNGGFNKRGFLFAPKDCLDKDPVIFEYLRNYLEKIEILMEKKTYKIGNIKFTTPIKHFHGVETYGLNFYGKNYQISIISDTKYFNGLEKKYNGDILIINVVLINNNDNIMHLSIKDVEKIIKENKPKLCIITHFGMNILKNKPWEIAQELSNKTKIKVIAANDGMLIKVNDYI